MLNRVTGASAARDRSVSLRQVVFFLPLACYWLLAIVVVFHPQPLRVLSISALPLLLITLAVIGSHLISGPKIVDLQEDGHAESVRQALGGEG